MYIFKEKQYFRKKFMFIILIIISVLSIYGAFTYALEQTEDTFNILNFIILLLPVAVAFLIGNLTLRTRIDEQGIQYQFHPLHRTPRLIKWSEISECYVRNYSPIAEYGGWGFRMSIFRKKGSAFSVSGRTGLQMKLKNGNNILLGTQKEDEIARVLRTYFEKRKV